MTPIKRSRGRPAHTAPSETYQSRYGEILEAAAQIFTKNGYIETSLDDVAQAINISKPTIYYYFPSKSHLFYHLAMARADEAIVKMAEISKIQDSRQKLVGLIRFQIEEVSSHPEFYRYFFDHRPILENKELKSALREKLSKYSQFLYDAIEIAICDKVLPQVDVFVATQAILSATFGIYRWHNPDKLTIDQLLDQFLILIHVNPSNSPIPESLQSI